MTAQSSRSIPVIVQVFDRETNETQVKHRKCMLRQETTTPRSGPPAVMNPTRPVSMSPGQTLLTRTSLGDLTPPRVALGWVIAWLDYRTTSPEPRWTVSQLLKPTTAQPGPPRPPVAMEGCSTLTSTHRVEEKCQRQTFPWRLKSALVAVAGAPRTSTTGPTIARSW